MFYRLRIELEKPGAFAQRNAILHDLDDIHAQANLEDFQLPDFEPNFKPLWLTDDSSLVDFVDDGSATGGLGLLVSKRARAVLEKLSLPPHRFYPLEVLYRGAQIFDEYYWLQIISVSYHDWIDYQKSEFRLKSVFEMDPDIPGDTIQLHNGNELRVLIDSLGDMDQDLLFSKITLNEKYIDVHYDIFYLYGLGMVYRSPIITHHAKQMFGRNELVGYRLTEVPLA